MEETTTGKQSLKPAYRSKHKDVKKKRHLNHMMWGRKVREYRFFFYFNDVFKPI